MTHTFPLPSHSGPQALAAALALCGGGEGRLLVVTFAPPTGSHRLSGAPLLGI